MKSSLSKRIKKPLLRSKAAAGAKRIRGTTLFFYSSSCNEGSTPFSTLLFRKRSSQVIVGENIRRASTIRRLSAPWISCHHILFTASWRPVTPACVPVFLSEDSRVSSYRMAFRLAPPAGSLSSLPSVLLPFFVFTSFGLVSLYNLFYDCQ